MNLNVPSGSIHDREGWDIIDKAVLTARGPLRDVIKQMQVVLNSAPVSELCEVLGIHSTGFLFIDYFKQAVRFFREGLPNPTTEDTDTYFTPYRWERSNVPAIWSRMIHWLFLTVRKTQISEVSGDPDEQRTEDYFINLPTYGDRDRALSLADTNMRERYGIHYCSVGEMIYTTFVWRALRVANDLGWGGRQVDDLVVPLTQPVDSSQGLRWRELELSSEEGPESRELQSIWRTLFRQTATWEDEWHSIMGAHSGNRASEGWRLNAALIFLQDSGILDHRGSPLHTERASCNTMLQRAARTFLTKLDSARPTNTIAECLDILETHARFPILPFYVWNSLDSGVKCYSVIPTWTSQHWSIKTPLGPCPHFGVALTASLPLSRIDLTIDPNRNHGRAPTKAISHVDPRALTSFLRLTATPLVEGLVYHRLIDEAERMIWESKREIHDTLHAGDDERDSPGKV